MKILVANKCDDKLFTNQLTWSGYNHANEGSPFPSFKIHVKFHLVKLIQHSKLNRVLNLL